MIGVIVKSIGKDNFFDSEAVLKALSESERKVLSKFGRYVQVRARSSIKKATLTKSSRTARRLAKKLGGKPPKPAYVASQPGQPPRSRRGDLKKFILFGYDAEEHNVIIGPTLVAGRPSETPHRLESGGTFKSKRGKMVTVKARPFMQPAFEKEMSKMPALFADSLFGR